MIIFLDIMAGSKMVPAFHILPIPGPLCIILTYSAALIDPITLPPGLRTWRGGEAAIVTEMHTVPRAKSSKRFIFSSSITFPIFPGFIILLLTPLRRSQEPPRRSQTTHFSAFTCSPSVPNLTRDGRVHTATRIKSKLEVEAETSGSCLRSLPKREDKSKMCPFKFMSRHCMRTLPLTYLCSAMVTGPLADAAYSETFFANMTSRQARLGRCLCVEKMTPYNARSTSSVSCLIEFTIHLRLEPLVQLVILMDQLKYPGRPQNMRPVMSCHIKTYCKPETMRYLLRWRALISALLASAT